MDATRRCMNWSRASTMLQAEPSDDIAVGGGKESVVEEKRKRKVRQAARKRTTGQVLRDIERCVNHVAGTLPVAIIVIYGNTDRIRTDCIVVSYDSTSQQKKKKLYWP